MRFLLGRTDALGDLIVSLPVMERILSHDPGAEIHWLVRPYVAPLLEGIRGLAGIHLRQGDGNLPALMKELRPDAVLNLNHRDPAVILAAAQAKVPCRVARARGIRQIVAATHLLWRGRHQSRRHEAQNALDFLFPWGWDGGVPTQPALKLTEVERALGESDLSGLPHPRLGIATRSSGSSAYPGPEWWNQAIPLLRSAGWNPVILTPPQDSELPESNLRGLLARIAACDAFLGPSTGPLQAAPALGVPTLALMGRSPNRGASRWAPLGRPVQVLTYPAPEGDLSGGMDRLDPADLIRHLERFH